MDETNASERRKPTLAGSLEIIPPSIRRCFHHGRELSVYYQADACGLWPKHRRAQIEIAFLFGPGGCRLGWAVDDLSWVEQDLLGPQIIVIGAGVEHECRIEVPCQLLVLYVGETLLPKAARKGISGVQLPNMAQHQVVIWMLASLMRYLCSARLRPDARVISTFGGELARYVIGLLRDKADSPAHTGYCFSISQREKVMRYIQANLKYDIHVVDLAKQTGHSKAHFAELFLNTIGRTPYQYLKEVRALKGYEMLLTGDYLVHEVALAVGYGDAEHFSILFREFSGHSPSEVLKRVRGSPADSPV